MEIGNRKFTVCTTYPYRNIGIKGNCKYDLSVTFLLVRSEEGKSSKNQRAAFSTLLSYDEVTAATTQHKLLRSSHYYSKWTISIFFIHDGVNLFDERVELSSDTLRFGVQYRLLNFFEWWAAVLKKAHFIDAQALSLDFNQIILYLIMFGSGCVLGLLIRGYISTNIPGAIELGGHSGLSGAEIRSIGSICTVPKHGTYSRWGYRSRVDV